MSSLEERTGKGQLEESSDGSIHFQTKGIGTFWQLSIQKDQHSVKSHVGQ